MNTGTRSWPNLVGKDGEEAVETIKRESGLTDVTILKPGMPMTKDYRTNRVRIQVDDQGKVTTAPKTG